jgi:endonuclease YncB( thermonuclease family)
LDSIDCPETKQPFGSVSKRYTGDLVFGKTVKVNVKTTDRWKRLVAEIVLPDGRVLNEELLKAGMGWVFVRYCRDARYYGFERDARERRLGLWADGNAVAPWEWRKLKASRRQLGTPDVLVLGAKLEPVGLLDELIQGVNQYEQCRGSD